MNNRAGTIKRQRRTKAETADLDRQIIQVLTEDHPQSVRHVFYRMTDPRLPEPVEKSDNGYRHVQHRLKELRRSGRVPYPWVVDMTRRGYFTNTFGSAAEFVQHMAGGYRADLWRDAETVCEVWVESRSLASVLIDLCHELAVDLYPCGGFSSISFAAEAAGFHNSRVDRRPLVIYYVGDYDPAGVLIDRALERELRQHLRPDIELRFERIGINADQVERYDLPRKPRKEGDRRSLHVADTVEAEAMPAHVLRALVRERVESLLPTGALFATQVAEESEREHLRRVAALMADGLTAGRSE